ncbi:MAG: LysR family transcriptional regulator [Gammaproteobacteria bacterium]|nr:LysR family transcriptional regulator [Gammaproteobacteria bacterium]MBU0892626.1 LysR family transcriptional regulator [Gammaproteobacteria bacterium]MBU1819615.1 LysR family transcriptional regulator [Gammaproteobacteria bacterium]
MLFDLRALGYFVAAYEERSVTAAARRCFVAQPSISMAIKGLEDALNTVLFERSRQGLTPTPAAHRLYPRACSLLAQSSAMVRDFRDAPRETLGVFLQDDLLVAAAAPLFAQLQQHWPHAMVRLTANAEDARLRLVAEHCKPSGDTFVSLWREPYVMLVPEQHPLRFKKRFGLADLKGLPLIEWPHCPLHQSFIRLLAERGIALEVCASAEREGMLLHMVDSGMGLAVVPQSHAAYARHAVIRPLDGALAFERHLGLACDASDVPMLEILGLLGAGMQTPAAPPQSSSVA